VSKELNPEDLGLDAGCAVPADDWILLGVRNPQEGSMWIRIQLKRETLPHVVCDLLASEDDDFPDPAFVASERPMLMALARAEEWRHLGADQEHFRQDLLAGRIEIGGNFGRFRRHLEWVLDCAWTSDLGAKLIECAGVNANGEAA
jgi:hypothetical protein